MTDFSPSRYRQLKFITFCVNTCNSTENWHLKFCSLLIGNRWSPPNVIPMINWFMFLCFLPWDFAFHVHNNVYSPQIVFDPIAPRFRELFYRPPMIKFNKQPKRYNSTDKRAENKNDWLLPCRLMFRRRSVEHSPPFLFGLHRASRMFNNLLFDRGNKKKSSFGDKKISLRCFSGGER